jgi:hypothetical protein
MTQTKTPPLMTLTMTGQGRGIMTSLNYIPAKMTTWTRALSVEDTHRKISDAASHKPDLVDPDFSSLG